MALRTPIRFEHQSSRGGLRLQDNRQAGQPPTNQSTVHFEHPLRASNTSLAVAGFGFRTIGRLLNRASNTHPLRTPTTSLAVAGFGFRTIGRLLNQPIQLSTSINLPS
ncbi:hypothetical protein N7517_008698 [Penicillium concentricum]|uniref:Uncharacterized protein n=1 Tax=Penicillium concentricum TaxID=293559 RepID=A0A9W9RSU6_9EURO|nr:uncharacterized protein N7517_008698 [Penicillium concentricum]KAJ5365812.1 hypothetical protein N7517_008698 [Penicillium concentricum]